MTTYIVVRPFAPGDEKEVKQIVREGTVAPLKSFYFAALTQEITIQVCVILSAIIFIVLGVPFHLCWISFPLVALLLFISFYLGDWYKTSTSRLDLDNLSSSYGSDPRTGFWVAEAWEPRSGLEQVSFCSEDEVSEIEKEGGMVGYSRRLVGTVGVMVKRDPDKKEPPNSVGFLRRLAVKEKYQHKGVGQELMTAAFKHCVDAKYRAVELFVTHSHYRARSFLEKQEWKMISSHDKTYMLFFTVGFYVFRKPCIKQQKL